jgi:hypothetical protein
LPYLGEVLDAPDPGNLRHVTLIWRTRAIVADLSGKNPNVFYEAGIAYTIGRDVIPITQSMDDIPFDLRSLRSVH